MIVIKAPAGFDPIWPAIPVDPTVTSDRLLFGENMPRRTVLDLAALLGPKDCERCDGEGWTNDEGCYPGCVNGKVPQRVALAIETPCETCDGRGCLIRWERGALRLSDEPCSDCVAGVRLRVEYTARVDAVYPIVEEVGDAPGDVVCCGEGILDFWPADATEYTDGVPLAWPPADWSPGRVAVLISDVQRAVVERDGIEYPDVPLMLRPFDGPVAELAEVLA